MHYVTTCLAYEMDCLDYNKAFKWNLSYYSLVLSVFVTQVEKKLLTLGPSEAGYLGLPSPRLCPH